MECNEVLVVNNVDVTLGGGRLLHQVNLSLNQGEIYAVVGANGAGKTTLLNVVTGDISASSGQVIVCGECSVHWTPEVRARHMAVLPQLSLLNFPYTVDDVVALGRIPHATGHTIDRQVVTEAMSAMDIEYLRGRLYTKLSGGEKQRTQLARVMAQIWRQEDADKRLLLLDEPTTALDLGHQQQLMQAITRFASQGVGVLMVVHDINLAARYADKIIALQCGVTKAQGRPEDILSADFVRDLVGAEVHITQHPKTERPVIIA